MELDVAVFVAVEDVVDVVLVDAVRLEVTPAVVVGAEVVGGWDNGFGG